MSNADSCIKITSIVNDGIGPSRFSIRTIDLFGESYRRLSNQQKAENFRLRTSDSSYSSTWHVAGDPTLLVVLSGCVVIELQDGESHSFESGDMFIAEDYLKKEVDFDPQTHGHRAMVSGPNDIQVLHLKLSSRLQD